MKVVADSSFLVALAMIDAFPLLPRIFSEIFISEEVYHEVVTRGGGLPGAEEVASAAWIKRTSVKDADKVKTYRAQRLGVGEAESLALAEELGSGLRISTIFKILSQPSFTPQPRASDMPDRDKPGRHRQGWTLARFCSSESKVFS